MGHAITGGCACGSVRYHSDGEVEFDFHCHCRKCQRATGGGHSSAFALDRGAVELTGNISYFGQTAETGYPTRPGFCPNCGSPVVSRTDRFPDRLYFHAATLDDPSTFEPTFTVFEDMAPPWDHIDPRLRSSAG
jgi:hypothetical protein